MIPANTLGAEVGPRAEGIDARWIMAYAAALGETDPRYFDTAAASGPLAHPLFAVCYAGSYNVPGVSGANRVAVFGSAANEETWESSAGSDLVRYMVGEGMVQGKANSSVEAAYKYGADKMYANQMGHPFMNDQVPGPLVLK